MLDDDGDGDGDDDALAVSALALCLTRICQREYINLAMHWKYHPLVTGRQSVPSSEVAVKVPSRSLQGVP